MPIKPPAITPLGNRVLVQRLEADTVTPGGLHLPDVTKNKGRTFRGKVLAVGRGFWHEGELVPPELVKGQTVLYPANSGFPVPHPGAAENEFVLIQDHECLGVEG